MTESAYFRGAGGIVWELDLPLNENMQRQITRGELVRVADADGSPWEDQPLMDLSTGELRRPGRNAPKTEWVGYAVSQGLGVDEADALTKNDLIERFGQ